MTVYNSGEIEIKDLALGDSVIYHDDNANPITADILCLNSGTAIADPGKRIVITKQSIFSLETRTLMLSIDEIKAIYERFVKA